MAHLANAFRLFRPFAALVIGDFFFDTYITGRVKRISPEAPVPVLEAVKQTSQPGGAGNVVASLCALEGRVFAVGRVGKDPEGQLLKGKLEVAGVDISAFIEEPFYKTPVKQRLIADSQQLLRVDFETIQPLSPESEEKVIARLDYLIQQVQIVAISDYGKGFLTRNLIETTIHLARSKNVPVIVDPKGLDFTKYKYATVLKPNLSEAYAAAAMANSASLDEVADRLLRLSSVDKLLITRSEAGMSLFEHNKERIDFPVHAKEVKDVTGAGDTVLSFICLSLACGLDIEQAAQLANIAASISIERLGCVQVTLDELAHRLLQMEPNNKMINENYSHAFRYLLKEKRYSLLVLSEEDTKMGCVLRAVKKLSLEEKKKVAVYIQTQNPTDELLHLLSSLVEVDTVILQDKNFQDLCLATPPEEIYRLEGEDICSWQKPVDLLRTLSSQIALKN